MLTLQPAPCANAGVSCEWPSGRRRKRSRKEMEEVRRQEAELASGNGERTGAEVSSPTGPLASGRNHQLIRY